MITNKAEKIIKYVEIDMIIIELLPEVVGRKVSQDHEERLKLNWFHVQRFLCSMEKKQIVTNKTPIKGHWDILELPVTRN